MQSSDVGSNTAGLTELSVEPDLAQNLEERAQREDPALLKKLLEQMLLMRRFEEKAAELYTLGKIGGFCHLYIGQEAVAVGALSTLGPDDYILTSYREHGHALVRGMDPGEVMAELCGKQSGVSKGKGGSMHLFDKRRGFLGGPRHRRRPDPSCRGGGLCLQVPQAAARHALLFRRGGGQYRIVPRVAEPGGVVEVAGGVHLRKQPFRDGHADRAGFFSLRPLAESLCLQHGARLGGRDGRPGGAGGAARKPSSVPAKESAPTLIEARTYRFMGHSMSDPAHGHYRTKSEVEEQRRHDPIKNLTAALEAIGVINSAFLEELEQKIRDTVEEAVAFAERSPVPEPRELYTDIQGVNGRSQKTGVRSQETEVRRQSSVVTELIRSQATGADSGF